MSENKPDSVMESTIDAAEWKLEVERVLPLLKVHIRTDNKVLVRFRSVIELQLNVIWLAQQGSDSGHCDSDEEWH